MTSTPTSDFGPTSSLPMLARRAAMLRDVRRAFDSAGYLEVDTPVLSHDVVVDAHIEPFVVRCDGPDGAASFDLFLQTSPEFPMKRLLAAGATAIYQIGHVFRNGELGQRHNPEFTMVEWYRVGDTHHDQMRWTEELVRTVCTPSAATSDAVSDRQRASPIRGLAERFDRLTYDEAFERCVGERVLDKTPQELSRLAARLDISAPAGLAADDRDGWLNLILAIAVEPHLGRERPLLLFDYPASQSALARIRHDAGSPRVAERFELYIDGVEICNGYHELTDAAELRRRMARQNDLREREGLRRLPMHNRLLDAMEFGLPGCSGVALGFDRLLMLATGAKSLDDVIPFPLERA